MYNYKKLKERYRGPFQRYIEHGIDPGDGFRSILENQLKSLALVDAECRDDMYDILMWMYWEIPCTAWGSEEKVSSWMRDHR